MSVSSPDAELVEASLEASSLLQALQASSWTGMVGGQSE